MKRKLLTILFLVTIYNFSLAQQTESEDEEVIEVMDIDASEDEYIESVPFAIVEEVPIFPGCDEGNNSEKKNCMNDQIKKHVAKNFNKSLVNTLNLPPGKNKIWTMFKISKTGDVIDIRIRAPHDVLKQEAERVVKLLPKMKPGKQRGEPINVNYMIPIDFVVADKSNAEKSKN